MHSKGFYNRDDFIWKAYALQTYNTELKIS